MKRHTFFLASLVVITLSTFIMLIYTLSPFLKPILWAIFLAMGLTPLNELLSRKLPKSLVALILTSLVGITFAIPLSIVATYTVKEALEITTNINEKNLYKFLENLYTLMKDTPLYPLIEEHLPNMKEKLAANITGLLIATTDYIKNILLSTGKIGIQFVLILFALFFFLKEGKEIFKSIEGPIPIEESEKEEILNTIKNTVLAVIYGTAGCAFLQSLVALMIFLAFKTPYSFLWGFLTFFASFIPPLGSAFIWLPVSAYHLLAGSTVKGIAIAILSTLFVSSLDNIVRPMIMKNRINLPFVVLFFSAFGGIIKFGLIGIFLGPLIASLLATTARIFKTRYLENIKKTD